MARSSVRGDYDTAARAKRIAIIAGIAAFVLLWVGVVLWLGRIGSAESSQPASSEVPVATTTQEHSVEDEAAAEEGSETGGEGQGSETQEQPAGSSVAPAQQEGSVPQGTFDPLQEEGNQPEGGQPEDSGGSEEPAPPSEAEIETTRARTASERYIVAAYGYTGSDEEEYLLGIEQAASEEIYDSPGGKRLKEYAKAAPECGMKSTAILEEFEVLGKSGKGLDAAVTFSVEDADGQTHTFRQEQRLSSSNGVHEVSAVSVEQLISDTTPTESCPGSGASESAEQDQSPDSANAVTDEQQVRSAAGRFISAAYGYSGNSTQEYRAGVEKTAIIDELLDSPGGERIEGYSETAGEEGIVAAAKLQRFEITSRSDQAVEGVAYFDVGRSYDRYGNLEGQTTPYKQELTLKLYEGSYRVSAASPEQQVEGEAAHGGERKLTS